MIVVAVGTLCAAMLACVYTCGIALYVALTDS